jgi:hypothetical protein
MVPMMTHHNYIVEILSRIYDCKLYFGYVMIEKMSFLFLVNFVEVVVLFERNQIHNSRR